VPTSKDICYLYIWTYIKGKKLLINKLNFQQLFDVINPIILNNL